MRKVEGSRIRVASTRLRAMMEPLRVAMPTWSRAGDSDSLGEIIDFTRSVTLVRNNQNQRKTLEKHRDSLPTACCLRAIPICCSSADSFAAETMSERWVGVYYAICKALQDLP